jgi:hypothetical protein
MQNHRALLHSSAEALFNRQGSAWLKLTREAARTACLQASDRGYAVVRIEAGIWRNPGFEARVDGIWDGANPPLGQKEANAQNLQAARNIEHEQAEYDTFILTVAPIEGTVFKS